MTDEPVERAFRQHPSFEQTEDDEFDVTFTPLEGTIAVTDDEEDEDPDHREYRVVVRAPDIDAVVESEKVAEVVQDGWFETLERRLEDTHGVADADATPPAIEREGEEVVVTVRFERADPERAAEDAKAIVEYVEGTWVQGLIPGYDYREPAATFRERAHQSYDDDARGPGSSGESADSSGSGGAPL